jgi:rod shape-determining protein MreC
MAPVRAWHGMADYLGGLDQALKAREAARAQLAAQSVQVAEATQLRAENERLRALLALRPGIRARAQAAEVMYEAADPYSRKLFIDRGGAHEVALGAPVIDEDGVLGQVTRLYPLTAEVTLLADRDAAIPVLNTRTQQRSVAFGGEQHAGEGAMTLRFVSGNADVRAGDLLVTSGLDGIYPPSLPVGRVASVDRRGDGGFARILVAPTARAVNVRHVLALEPLLLQLPPRPDGATAGAAAAASAASAAARKGGRR